MLQQLKARYEQYEQELHKVIQKASIGDGLFGMGADPKAHPCHDSFYEAVEEWVGQFVAAQPSPEEAAEAAQWIIQAADAHRDMPVYWYMYAAQQLALPLIERMEPERCETLMVWYDRAHKKVDRMPAQQKVYKLLRKRAKGK